MSNSLALVNGLVQIGSDLVKASLVMSDGKIISILGKDESVEGIKTIDCTNMVVAPGLIDLHIHGGGGGFSQNFTDSDYEKIVTAQLYAGTTSIVLTYMGASVSELADSAELILRQNKRRKGANILGMHIEGPWISPKKIGYLSPDLFDFSCSLSHARKVKDACNGLLRIVTLAPELEGVQEIIHELSSAGIIASCGHTEAGYAATSSGIQAGIRSFTHLWNMSGPVQSREPGVVGCALQHDECFIELVADGFHVHPANVKNTIQSKPKDKVCLVTDAMIPTSTDMKTFSFMGVDGIEVRDGRTYGPNGAIIGSVLTQNKAISNVIKWTGLDLPTVLNMASANPAKLLGLYPQKGLIAVGSDADVAVFDSEMKCHYVVVGGELKYRD